MTQSTYNVGSASQLSRQYGPYVEANWGFANHWYPGVFSHEVEERGVVGITIGGHDIAVTRDKDGKSWAISDRCIHKGVRMSEKPTCFANKTVSCWYHGFTFNVEDGNLDTIVGSPNDKLINNARVRTYPTEEFAGIIWVFVGDEDYDVPPVETDIPMKITDKPNAIAYLKDPDVLTAGIRRPMYGNWRLAVENGLDPGHLLVHWNSPIIIALGRGLPLGMQALRDDATEILDLEDGPKGVMNRYDKPENYMPIFTNDKVEIEGRFGTNTYEPFRVSAWLPCTVMVENWPLPDYAQFEFMVPIDDHNHMYWEVIVYRGTTDAEKAEFKVMYDQFFLPLGLYGFNNDDIPARAATEEFYEKRDGWNNEVLADSDFSVVAWRKHAAKHGRGFFESPFADED